MAAFDESTLVNIFCYLQVDTYVTNKGDSNIQEIRKKILELNGYILQA